mmetsp:Transcript_7561/g.10224  ORF Transcript_7561/g.10224 Transcript_7561/m.10224 type:complete len:268 (+) Transcript_7561:387-1190(+)
MQLINVILRDKRQAPSRPPGSGGPPCTVHVIPGYPREVIVHHQVYTGDVKSSGCHVCCHQDVRHGATKGVQGGISLQLVLSCVQGGMRHPQLGHHSGKALTSVTGGDKYDCGSDSPSLFHVVQNVGQVHLFYLGRDKDVFLLQLFRLDCAYTIVLQEVIGVLHGECLQLLDGGGERSGEEKGLPGLRQALQEHPQLGLKALIQQAVRLVENQKPKLPHRFHHPWVAFKMSQQPAGRGHHHVRALAQHSRLLRHVHASNDYLLLQSQP